MAAASFVGCCWLTTDVQRGQCAVALKSFAHSTRSFVADLVHCVVLVVVVMPRTCTTNCQTVEVQHKQRGVGLERPAQGTRTLGACLVVCLAGVLLHSAASVFGEVCDPLYRSSCCNVVFVSSAAPSASTPFLPMLLPVPCCPIGLAASWCAAAAASAHNRGPAM